MRTAALFVLALAAPLAAHAAPAPEAAPPLDPKLQKALAGRSAGEPVSCIPLQRSGRSHIYNGAIVYEQGRRWYVNRPDQGRCTPLRPDRAIVSRTPGTQLCRGDIITIIDPPTPITYGSCGLGDFVPYFKEAR